MDLKEYFSKFDFADEFSLKSNEEYFQALFDKFQNNLDRELKIHHPEAGVESNIIPAAILDSGVLPVTDYEKLSEISPKLRSFNLVLCKMHAGLGSSVEREEYLKKLTGRCDLGSKGTDLFIEIDGKNYSLAQLQIEQAKILKAKNLYKNVVVQNLVNEETLDALKNLNFEGANVVSNILQLKVPTIKNGKLTDERLAPAGHAYLGFALLSKIFNQNTSDDLYVIGNGEDLNSTADDKILSWVVDNDIPVTMITTTKLFKDKKGGQISLVKDTTDYVTIIEKAQAEKAGQLKYFEELGLRENDNKSLFNTNIVVINAKALKARLEEVSISFSDFKNLITPDLIKNTKEQDGENFIQLEGAIGSTMLNLDKFFRFKTGKNVLSFLNLDPKAREHFFIPIKTMDDFYDLLNRYEYNKLTGRLDLKV